MAFSSTHGRSVLVAVVLYLGGALWALRVVLPAPATILPESPSASEYWGALLRGDQLFSVARITESARLLTHAPQRLMDGINCWPMPRATTLGEHMIGEGILGVIPHLLFHEPILTYNVVLVLMPVIAGLTMYALVFAFTASAQAALIAGLLFAIHPARLSNAAQPYWMGNHWAPLALLFAHRLFTGRRWSAAVCFGLFSSLQLLDSFYPVVAFAFIGGTYVCSLLVHERCVLRMLAPKLLVAGLIVAAVAACVFVPYLQTRSTWPMLLSGRDSQLYLPMELGFGGQLYPGTVMTLLAVLGLVDRIRGPRLTSGHDPRIPFAIGGTLVLWAVLKEVSFMNLHIPSLLNLAKGFVPGMDAVRVGLAVSSGFYLVCAVLAGFGMFALLRGTSDLLGRSLTAVLAVGALLEVFHPGIALVTYNRAIQFEAHRARPADDVLAVYARAPEGAVLDLPAHVHIGAEYVFLSAYHGRSTVGCYGSYVSPVAADVIDLARRLRWDPRAAVALHALGVRSIVSHHPTGGVPPGTTVVPPGPHVLPRGYTGSVQLYELVGTTQVDASLDPVVAGSSNIATIKTPAGTKSLAVPFRNGRQVVYRHPDPIAPTAVRAQWLGSDDQVVAQYETSVLLPLVLTPGETMSRQVPVLVPTVPGQYLLVLVTASNPNEVLARIAVDVGL